MTIEQKLEKRIKTIIEMSGEYPREIEITEEEYNQIKKDTFRNVKLIVKK